MSTFVNNNVSSGDIVRASDHNTQGANIAAVINGNIDNDNISSSAAIAGSKLADDSVTYAKLEQPVAFSAYRSTAVSISGTLQKINLDGEEYDHGSDYDNTTNYHFTAPYDGVYSFGAGLRLTNLDAAGDGLLLYLYKNGATAVAGAQNVNVTAATGDLSTNFSKDIELTAGDTIEMWAQHTSASSEAVATGIIFTYLTGHLVGRTD